MSTSAAALATSAGFVNVPSALTRNVPSHATSEIKSPKWSTGASPHQLPFSCGHVDQDPGPKVPPPPLNSNQGWCSFSHST